MDPKTLTALKASIAKWERNVEAETPDKVLLGASECALCKLFIYNLCKDCPVRARSGSHFCRQTPFVKTINSFFDWNEGGSKDSWREAAQAEVDFLKSLLPEGEQS